MYSDSQYVKKIIILPLLSAFLTEVYLDYLRAKGLRLLSWHGLRFTFATSSQKSFCYFVHFKGDMGSRRGEAKYSLTLRHPNIEKVYGVKKSLSKLNQYTQNTSSAISIIEVSPQVLTDSSYKELLSDRCKLYYLGFLCQTAIFYLCFSAFIINASKERFVALLSVNVVFFLIALVRTILFFYERRYVKQMNF